MSLLQGVSKENAVMGGADGTEGSLPGPGHLDSMYESLESPPQHGGRTVVLSGWWIFTRRPLRAVLGLPHHINQHWQQLKSNFTLAPRTSTSYSSSDPPQSWAVSSSWRSKEFVLLSFFLFFFMVTRMLHWASREKKFEVKPGSSTGRIRGKGNGRQRLRRKKGNIPSVASRPGWSFITGCLSAPSVGLGLPVLRWRVCCVSGEVVSVCKTN